jgi:succinoglycan biosynthesis protein ExoH
LAVAHGHDDGAFLCRQVSINSWHRGTLQQRVLHLVFEATLPSFFLNIENDEMSIYQRDIFRMIKIDEEISERIAILRYLMVFGIIVLHTPYYVPLTEIGPGAFDFIKALFQHAIFRTSVPILTFVSGYLLFNTTLDLQFKKLVVKKIQTILVPLIIFNLPVAVAVYLVQANQLMDYQFSTRLYPFDHAIWADAVLGLFGATINYPLNFLRDLFLISLFSPLFGFFLRRYSWYGMVIVFFIFWFDLDGQLILRNSMPIVFYMGGMASVRGWNLRKLDRFSLPFLAIFLMLCIATIIFRIENRSYLRLVSPLLIWPIASLLVSTRFGGWLAKLSKYSFLIFLAHGPLLLVAMLIYKNIFAGVPYWIFWVMTPIIISIFLSQVYIYSQRYFPKIMNVLLGAR